MNIDAIAVTELTLEPINANQQTLSTHNTWFEQVLTTTNEQLINSDNALTQLAQGNNENLHNVMIDLEQAKLSLQLVEQLRNRALSAYQELMKEQL